MSELITKLNPALVMEAMQAPAIIYEKDSIEQFIDESYKSHIYDSSTRIGVIILRDSTIPFGMFSGRPVRKVQLLNITSIGDKAFYNCGNLTSIIIPDSVTKMGKSVFTGCTGELTINCPMPDNSGYTFSAFMGAKFTKITIGNGVTSIGDWTFYGCGDLTSVTIPNSVTSIGGNAFYHCWALTNVTIPDSVTSIGEYAFKGCSKLEHVTIGNGVTSIGNSAFYGCIALTSITIPDSVTYLGNDAFSGCSSLTSATIGNGITSIRDFVFWECSNLKDVIIPDSVTQIGECAFFECGLTSVTIPKHVTYISDGAFNTCSQLSTIYCKASTPPDTVEDAGCLPYNSNLKIYIPINSLESYKNHEYWQYRVDALIETVFEDEVLESGTNIKTIGGQSILGEGDISFVQPITYLELRTLYEKGELAPGQKYRITDYQSMHSSSSYMSGKTFDLLVQALDTKTLSHDAKAIAKESDTYFKMSDLGKWELKYDIQNDSDKYAWCKEDEFGYLQCVYGIIAKGIYNWMPAYDVVDVNNKTFYLYDIPYLKDYCEAYGISLYHIDTSNSPDINNVVFVTDTTDFNEDYYDHVILYAMDRNTGTIFKEWQATAGWSDSNLGFGWNSAGSGNQYDMILTGNSISIDGNIYYLWDDYSGDLEASGIYDELGSGSKTIYEGDFSSLKYALSSPITSSTDGEDDDPETSLSLHDVKAVYDTKTGLLYTRFHFAECVYEEYFDACENSDSIDCLVYNTYTCYGGKGVIYYMKDDNGNEAPFDFKTLFSYVPSLSSPHYLFGESRDMSLTSSVRNNKIVTNTPSIPRVSFTSNTLLNNTVYCRSYDWFTSGITYKNCTLYTPTKSSTQQYLNDDVTCTNCVLDIQQTVVLNGAFSNCNITTIGPNAKSTSRVNWYNSTLFLEDTLTVESKSSVYNTNLTIKYPTNWTNSTQTSTDAPLLYISNTDGNVITWEEGKLKVCDFTGTDITMQSGVFYRQLTATDTLKISVSHPKVAGEYTCTFRTLDTGTTLICPKSWAWNEGMPTLENNTYYKLTIIDDIATCSSAYYDSEQLIVSYQTSSGNVISTPTSNTANVVSNLYSGSGVIKFDRPPVDIGNLSRLSGITYLSLPESVQYINKDAFYSSTIDKLILPSSITTFDSDCFDSANIKNLYVPNLDFIFKASIKSASANPLNATNIFVNDVKLTDITIPESITHLGPYVCALTSKSKHIIIPNTITTMDERAFGNASSLYSRCKVTLNSQGVVDALQSKTVYNPVIIFGPDITKVNFTLDNNRTQYQVTIPSNVKSVSLDSNASNLTLLYISSVDDWCNTTVTKMIRPTAVALIGTSVSLQDITISDNVTKICSGAFRLFPIKSVTIGNSVTSIGEYAFYYCTSLTSVTIGNSVTEIGEFAFNNCHSLTSITIPDSVTSIGNHAFYGCTSLTSVTIPDSVTSIGEYAFYYCRSLTSVYCKPTTPPAGSSYMFNSNASSRKIYVPRNSVDAYKSAEGWSGYANYIEGYDF